MNLHDAVPGYRVLSCPDEQSDNPFQHIDEFFPGMAVHFQIISVKIGEGHQRKDTRKKPEAHLVVG